MKNLFVNLTFGLVALFLCQTVAAADTEYQRQFGRAERDTMVVSSIDLRKNIIVIGDLSYSFDNSLRVHTGLTNFGTVRSLKIGDTVTFRLKSTKKGPILADVWVTEKIRVPRSR